MRSLAIACALVALALLVPSGARSADDALIAKLTTDLQAATTVVVGVVRGSRPVRGANDFITSTHTVQRTRVLKGVHAAGYLTITIPGGTVGDLTMGVSYLPALQPGDKVLLLLDAAGKLRPGQTVYRLTATDNLEHSSVSLATVQGLIP